mgnify:CR=1 FL=1
MGEVEKVPEEIMTTRAGSATANVAATWFKASNVPKANLSKITEEEEGDKIMILLEFTTIGEG